MKSSARLLVCVIGLCFSAYSQSAIPSSTPPDDDDVVKITTTLIQLDAVVTDKDGKQVGDLTADDFEVFERGEKQKITFFSYVSSAPAAQTESNASTSGGSSSQVVVPTTRLNEKQVRRTYAIVVDDLGISAENIPDIKRALKRFVNEQVQQGDLVAIIRTGRGSGSLQSFTSDKRQLLAAVDKIRYNVLSRGGLSTFSKITTSLKEDLAGQVDSDGNVSTPEGIEEDNAFNQTTEYLRNQIFEAGTLGALGYVVSGMSELPGRKSVILFTEGLSSIDPADRDTNSGQIFEKLRVLAEYANRSSVVFYTIDPRGLQVPGMAQAQDIIRDIFTDGAKLDARETSFLESQASIRFLASETGGVPFLNNNSMTKGLDRAMEDQKGYYLIAYEPDEETFESKKPKYNEIKITVKRKDLTVRTRNGFYGIPDSKITEPTLSAGEQLRRALLSPFGAGDVSISLNTLLARDGKNGQFLHSLVYIDGNDLTFEKQPDGTRKANFDLVAMTLDERNRPVDSATKNYTMTLSESNYQSVLEKGFVYTLDVPIKKPGGYQFRIALRDSTSAKVGSASQFVVVPNPRKNRLNLSSIVLNRFSGEQWRMIRSGAAGDAASTYDNNLDNALRVFSKGDVLQFGYFIYDVKPNGQLEIRIRLIRDGKVVVEGPPGEMASGNSSSGPLETNGAITLGTSLESGAYVLQVIVTDKGAKKKYSTATQWVEFEIAD